jgi:hypothetical protein
MALAIRKQGLNPYYKPINFMVEEKEVNTKREKLLYLYAI